MSADDPVGAARFLRGRVRKALGALEGSLENAAPEQTSRARIRRALA